MVKSVKSIFVVLVFGSFISYSFNEEREVNEKPFLGDKAPELVFKHEKQMLNLHANDGKYTLLSFWAAYDANSRVRNAELSRITDNNAHVKMISVSFDRYRSVYDAAMRQDGLRADDCHWEKEGEKSDLFRAYGLKNGFKNYLLDSNGVIVAANVTADELSAYL